MPTFFKICTKDLYKESRGGRRADSLGELRLINGSEVFWMHLENWDEGTVKGLEVNSVFIDQAEEISEGIYDILDSRVGRWDKAEIPPYLDAESFPKDHLGRPQPPSYTLLACNPADYLHWIYRKYHPDSPEHWALNIDEDGNKFRWHDTHVMLEAKTSDNPLISKEIIQSMKKRDSTWVRKYFFGKWGNPEGSIHEVSPDSIISEPDLTFVEFLQKKAALYRVLDHGETSPTCCLWFAYWNGFHFCYREYYRPNATIEEHRREIHNLSIALDGNYEKTQADYADPSIFAKTRVKQGQSWTIAEEYTDSFTEAPPIFWYPADNNEMVARDRLNTLLKIDPYVENPFTKEKGSPRIFFLQKSESWPHGCENAIKELQSQRREQIDTINGMPVYSDDRSPKIPDHAYDCERYYVNIREHNRSLSVEDLHPRSFLAVRQRAIRQRRLLKRGRGIAKR